MYLYSFLLRWIDRKGSSNSRRKQTSISKQIAIVKVATTTMLISISTELIEAIFCKCFCVFLLPFYFIDFLINQVLNVL